MRLYDWNHFVLGLICYVASSYGNQTALLQDLFSNYPSDVRPVCGVDVPMEVKVGIALRQVINLNEPEQSIFVNMWMRLRWTDCYLTWNASDYGGADTLILPYSKIWTPDITLYDNAGDGIPGIKDYRPSVKSDGSVSYNFPTIVNSLCKIDVTSFPFDTQRCAMPFGSWSYHGLELNITSLASEGDATSFKSNSEWDLVGIPVERHVVYYGCCPEPYPDVTFYVTLTRKPMFYLFNLLFPCMLISLVALLGFILPADSGEKVSLEITVMLSLSVFMLVVSQTLPPTSETFPVIGIYFCIVLMLATLSTLLSVIVINVHFRGQLGHSVPRWIRKVFLGKLAVLLRVRHDVSVHPAVSQDRKVTMVVPCTDRPVTAFRNQTPGLVINNSRCESVLAKTLQDCPPPMSIDSVHNEQLSILRKLDKQWEEKNEADDTEEEWKTVAVVIDRLCFVIVTVLLIVFTVVIMFVAAF